MTSLADPATFAHLLLGLSARDLLNALVAGLTAIGLILTMLGLRAWFRYGERRLAFLFAAFLGFLAQGVLLT
jgi:hypothetical protein